MTERPLGIITILHIVYGDHHYALYHCMRNVRLKEHSFIHYYYSMGGEALRG